MSRSVDEGARVVYQHPLAYLLGLEGIALLRAFAGEHGREFTLARIRRSEPCWTPPTSWATASRRRR